MDDEGAVPVVGRRLGVAGCGLGAIGAGLQNLVGFLSDVGDADGDGLRRDPGDDEESKGRRAGLRRFVEQPMPVDEVRRVQLQSAVAGASSAMAARGLAGDAETGHAEGWCGR